MTESVISNTVHTPISNRVTTPTGTPTGALIQFNPTAQLPIKLTGSLNFTTWKAQFELLLFGHDLLGHLDGSLPPPPAHTMENNKETLNPAHHLWLRQDKLIQTALLASVEPTLASMVATAVSSHAAWTSLHTAYANKSQTRIFSLRDHLLRLTKNSKTVAEYLQEIRTIADELAIAGSPLSIAELIVKVLNGLGPEFNMIASSVRARESPISWEELSGLLLDEELTLKHQESQKQASPITVAVAQRTGYSGNFRNNQRRYQSSGYQGTHWRNNQTRNVNNNWRPQNPSSQFFMPPGDGYKADNRPRCQLCDKPGHTARVCRSQSHNHMEAKAHFASRSQHPGTPWIVDSGASHHITSNPNNFSEAHEQTSGIVFSVFDNESVYSFVVLHMFFWCANYITASHIYRLQNYKHTSLLTYLLAHQDRLQRFNHFVQSCCLQFIFNTRV